MIIMIYDYFVGSFCKWPNFGLFFFISILKKLMKIRLTAHFLLYSHFQYMVISIIPTFNCQKNDYTCFKICSFSFFSRSLQNNASPLSLSLSLSLSLLSLSQALWTTYKFLRALLLKSFFSRQSPQHLTVTGCCWGFIWLN